MVDIRFWGVRGSYPVPGPSTNRYGGNTPCVEVSGPDGSTIIIDAGTGIRRLGQKLVQEAFGRGQGTCHLLISHTHWDHIQGLPFFAPLYTAGNLINIFGRRRDIELATLFGRKRQSPYFPMTLEDATATLSYNELLEGATFPIGPVTVSCTALNHPYVALGYRLQTSHGVVAYVSDTAPFDHVVLGYEFVGERPNLQVPLTEADREKLGQLRQGVVELCRNADLVIYDTMFEMAEYDACPHWGHSAPEHALSVVSEACAKTLILFHHHPSRTDAQQDLILERVQEQSTVRVLAAAEGMSLHLSQGTVEECR